MESFGIVGQRFIFRYFAGVYFLNSQHIESLLAHLDSYYVYIKLHGYFVRPGHIDQC